ncbi:hypothetical protein A2415_00210 [candidate division WWE3 bacterium RIFOXYC1_FULL_39_7]|uniref:DUF5659 domain-containing protein n=1 Tax=candidate division WWE3 bacterium RIFOXYC1_FULL_39_7 TaxID=1802643 RepID=A0A1F4WIC7_UNCKA|nr:MAG: hypothetical protein A2415_00210 [candidate division WWE3 bacterium RIFOXYC1_FULL_39_7]
MSNVNVEQWKSKDFYLSSVIRAAGFDLLSLEKNNHDFSVFVFGISPQKAEEIISLHWSKQLRLPTRNLIEAINELRTRLKSGV